MKYLTQTNMVIVLFVHEARITTTLETRFHIDTFSMVTHSQLDAHVVQTLIDVSARGVFTGAIHTGSIKVSRSCS